MSYIVLPEFHVSKDNLEQFIEAAKEDAIRSVSDEDGCLQFDVIVNLESDPIIVKFYEVYKNKSAFEQHLQTAHLNAFRKSLSLCDEQPVVFFERIVP